jgi:hypothetical protein
MRCVCARPDPGLTLMAARRAGSSVQTLIRLVPAVVGVTFGETGSWGR